MEIRRGVYAYEVDWEYDEPLGIHVIDTEAATVLFGTGSEPAAEAVVDIARDNDVDIAIVEHGHADHYGGVPALREAVDVEVAIPAGDADRMREEGMTPDHVLKPEGTYWGVETIPAPGHTPDNMAYRYDDVLVAGDTIVGSDSLFAAAGDWTGGFAVIEPSFNTDDDQMRASVPELLAYPSEIVLVSHGSNVTASGTAAIETLVADLNRAG